MKVAMPYGAELDIRFLQRPDPEAGFLDPLFRKGKPARVQIVNSGPVSFAEVKVSIMAVVDDEREVLIGRRIMIRVASLMAGDKHVVSLAYMMPNWAI